MSVGPKLNAFQPWYILDFAQAADPPLNRKQSWARWKRPSGMVPSFYFPVSSKRPHLSPCSYGNTPGNLAKYADLTGNDAHSPNSSRGKRGLPVSAPHCANTGSVEQLRRGSEAVKCVRVSGGQTPWTFDKLKLSTYLVAGNVLHVRFTAVHEAPCTIPGGSHIFSGTDNSSL